MQYQPREDYKIYSRPRLNLVFLKNTPKAHKSRRKIKNTMPVVSIFLVAIITCFSLNIYGILYFFYYFWYYLYNI